MALNKKKYLSWLCWSFCIVLSAVLIYRWNRIFFALATEEIADAFSDFPEHIKFALERTDYSLASYVVRFLFSIGEEHFARTALSLVLTANHVLTAISTVLLLRYLFPKTRLCFLVLAAELSLVCAPWILPPYQTTLYIGACNGNLYHNMTILFSRSFIPLDFLFFLKCWNARHDKLPSKYLLLFCLSFLITTLFKASFAFAFIPMLAAILLYDFIKYRARYFKNEILLGLTVVPAGIACIIQYTVLFANDFAGTSSQMAVRLVLGAELMAIIVMYLRSFLLPSYTLALRGMKEDRRRDIAFITVCQLIAIIEAVVFIETGYRATDGNFDWGSLAIQSSVFAIGISLLINMLSDCALKGKPRGASSILPPAIGLILLLGHLATGVYFLRYFAAGKGFWI